MPKITSFSRTTYFYLGNFVGGFSSAIVLGIIQDLYGLENWLRFERQHWESTSITWPIEGLEIFILIAIGFWIGRRAKRDEQIDIWVKSQLLARLATKPEDPKDPSR